MLGAPVAASLWATPAAGEDARRAADRVREQWGGAGARTATLPTRFVFDDETVLIPVTVEGDEPCTQVAVVGARGMSFRARLSDAPTDPLLPPEPGARASSAAGVLELRRCDPERPAVRHVVVTSEAGRGAVELVVGRSTRPLPPLGSILPARTGGAVPAPARAGSLPPLDPQDRRADAAEARARREGGRVAARGRVRAGDDGVGEDDVDLDAGCHRLEVFGRERSRERPGHRFRLDVDAELRDGEQLLTRNRTEAPDARLETCVGESTRVTLVHAGSPPHTEVVVTRATWPLPARLPTLWGPVARSRMARVMLVRHVAAPVDDPVLLAQGGTGTTPVPVSLEVGGCYVAVVGVARGSARQLQLRAHVGARESTDERGSAENAALASFCVRAHEAPRLEVLARGVGVSWGLALFRIDSAVWEAPR